MDQEGTRWPKTVSQQFHAHLRETTDSLPGVPMLPAAQVMKGGEGRMLLHACHSCRSKRKRLSSRIMNADM